MKPVYLDSVSVLGPGLPDWLSAQAIFDGRAGYSFEPTPAVNCGYLSPNVKRRTTLHMQVALHAAEKALAGAAIDPSDIELVFSSAEGDLGIADEIFRALVLPEKLVSPQKFQNVILNAAIGHLGIILKNRSSATSVSGGEYSFAVGLLQAATSVIIENRPVLYVAYDCVGPTHLDPRKSDSEPFSVGMLLSPTRGDRSIGSLQHALLSEWDDSRLDNPELEQVRCSIGAARSLPLLDAIARNTESAIMFPYCEASGLKVEFHPCQ